MRRFEWVNKYSTPPLRAYITTGFELVAGGGGDGSGGGV